MGGGASMPERREEEEEEEEEEQEGGRSDGSKRERRRTRSHPRLRGAFAASKPHRGRGIISELEGVQNGIGEFVVGKIDDEERGVDVNFSDIRIQPGRKNAPRSKLVSHTELSSSISDVLRSCAACRSESPDVA
eukprot:755813-Hanusia_phi.AAC.3